MSEKRRALGRGLGALIPSTPPGDTSSRPVDVFFKDSSGTRARQETIDPVSRETTRDGAVSRETGAGARSNGEEQLRPVAHAGPAGDVSRETVTNRTDGFTGNHEGQRDGARDHHAGVTSTGNGVPGSSATQSEPSAANDYAQDATHVHAAQNGHGSAPSGGVMSDRAEVNGAFATPPTETPEPTVDADAAPAMGAADGLAPVPGARFAELPVLSIRPNPRQPRTVFDDDDMAELRHSIAEIGVLQPVVVRPIPAAELGDSGEPGDGKERPQFELIMGERRWRASQEAGLSTVPAIIKETHDDDLLRDALLENLHRSQLNALEEAAAYQQLLDDFGCTHDQLATRIGRSRPQISNTLRLLKLPPLVQRRVAAGVLSAGHARALLGLADGAAMERLAQRIVAEGLSVRNVEEIVTIGSNDAPRPARRPRAGARHPQLDDLAARLSDRFDTRVSIALGQRKGKLTVEFASVDDLNRIVELLGADAAAHAGD